MDPTTAPAIYRDATELPLGTLERRANGRVAEPAAPSPVADDSGRNLYKALAYDTSSTDLHGTTIAPEAFRELPVGLPVLLFHNKASFPVGKVVGWEPSERGPVAVFRIHTITEEARAASALIDDGILDGVSIGFLGYEAENRSGIPTYTDVELVELSLTPVPSSRAARVQTNRDSDTEPFEDDVTAAELPQENATEPAIDSDAADPVEHDVALDVAAATVAREAKLLRRVSQLHRLR